MTYDDECVRVVTVHQCIPIEMLNAQNNQISLANKQTHTEPCIFQISLNRTCVHRLTINEASDYILTQ